MPFDFAQAKADARRALHDGLSVAATYEDTLITEPLPIRVRYHNRIVIEGDPYGLGMAETIEGSDKVVFEVDPLVVPAVARGGIIRIPQYSLAFRLEAKEPSDGPITQTWRVTRV